MGQLKKEVAIRRRGWVLTIIGVTISLVYGFLCILTVNYAYSLGFVIYQLMLLFPPFFFGFFLMLYGIYSIKLPYAAEKGEDVAVLPILRGLILLFLLLTILINILFNSVEVSI